MSSHHVAVCGVLMALLLVACDRKDAAAPPRPQQLVGKWLGPEATYLEITQVAGRYTVHIRNLDGVRSFPAELVADGLSFQRDGVPEVIRATDGKGTGMKWLADKSDCLGIRPGEGYCRN